MQSKSANKKKCPIAFWTDRRCSCKCKDPNRERCFQTANQWTEPWYTSIVKLRSVPLSKTVASLRLVFKGFRHYMLFLFLVLLLLFLCVESVSFPCFLQDCLGISSNHVSSHVIIKFTDGRIFQHNRVSTLTERLLTNSRQTQFRLSLNQPCFV